MLLIVEIALTIWAWNKGWRWYSLLPVGICLGIGFILGIGIGLNGGSANDIGGGVVVLDILAIIALIYMISKKKTPVEEEKPKE